MRPWPWAIAATACAPLLFRGAAVARELGAVSAVDLRGALSDVAVAGVAAALALLLARLHRVAALAWLWIWTAGHYANYELVRTLGSPASVRELQYLFDPTFFAGSALAISAPWLLAGALVAGSGALGWATTGARSGGALTAGVAGVLLGALVALLPDAPEEPVWRRVDFLQRDVARGLARLAEPARDVAAATPPDAMLERLPELAADLGGTPRIPAEPRARNVLLVVLESISGIHLPSFAAEHGREADAEMPALEALSRDSLRFVSFVAHQRKTNRGLYALLCGELPNLGEGTPKMTAASLAPWRVCLPEVLRDAGWHTVYLQAAPLSFMLKDRFMGSAGFEEVLGYDGTQQSYSRSPWGVDDKAFFEQAEAQVAALRRGERPWLLTLLNVGTHHPYTLPDDYRPGRRRFRRAASYLDEAFGAFVERLEASGALRDTLLVVTSDESLGIGGFDTQPAFKLLSQNWGILLLQGPGVAPGVVREPFGLADLPLSVLDYLGLAEQGAHFFGRSVLRAYDTPRHLFFGNMNLGALGALEPGGSVLVCNGGACRRHAVPDGRWFGVLPDAVPVEEDDAGVVLLRDLAARSEPREGHRPERYDLLAEPDVVLPDDRPHMLHGGQFVRLRADEWLEVEYTVTLEGAARVDWRHRLTGARNESLFEKRARLSDGDTLTLRYRYVPEGEKGQIQCRTTVRRVSGGDATLRHGPATLRIRRGERPAVGATLLGYDLAAGA
ncbi:MAG: LTA synthase family protein [Myxococcota bacterium]